MAKLVPVGEKAPAQPNAKLVPVQPTQSQTPFLDPEKLEPVSRGEQFMRGVSDVGQGIKQLYLMATDPEAAKKYTAEVNAQEMAYQLRRQMPTYQTGTRVAVPPEAVEAQQRTFGIEPKSSPYDVQRVMGNVAATSPTMAIGGGTSLLPRLALGATQGALAGGLTFAPTGTWSEKGQQAGLGALGGAVLPELLRGGAKTVVYGGQKVASAANKIRSVAVSENTLRREIADAIKQAVPEFPDFASLNKGMQDNLVAEERKQLSVTGELNPQALALSQDYESLGLKPTLGQVTRDPRQFARELNLAQLEGVGEDILQRRRENVATMQQRLSELKTGEAKQPIDVGIAAREVVGERVKKSGIYGEMGKKIDDMWEAARSAKGADSVLPFEDYSARIADTLDNFEDVIPAPIAKRLAEFGNPESGRLFSISEAAKFRTLINQRMGENPAQAKALGQLKRQLDDFIVGTADSLGGPMQVSVAEDAIKKFQTGVKASAKRAQLFEADPLDAIVSGRATPDEFFNKYVINGKVEDMTSMRDLLLRKDISPELQAKGAATWESMRGQTIQHIMDKAFPGGEGFSQDAYRIALEKLGPRMEILFTPEERGTLFALQRASQGMLREPATGGVPLVNRSGTTAFAYNLMQKLPGINYVRQAAQQAAQEASAATALRGAAALPEQQSAADKLAREAIANLTTRYLPGSAAGSSLLQEERRSQSTVPGLLFGNK